MRWLASPQAALFILHAAGTAAAAYGIWLLARRMWGEGAAAMALALAAVSLTQFLAYWSLFIKMTLSLAAAIFALYFAEKGLRLRAGIMAGAAAALHPVAALPLIGAFIARGAETRNTGPLIIAGLGAAIGGLFHAQSLYGYGSSLIAYATGDIRGKEALFAGHFFPLEAYHALLFIFYVPLGLIMLARALSRRRETLAWYAAIALGLMALHAPFHNRYLILFDAAMILYAAQPLWNLAARACKSAAGCAAMCAIIGLTGYQAMRESARIEPLLTTQEFGELRQAANLYPGLPIALQEPIYRQMVEGYTKHAVIIMETSSAALEKSPIPLLVYNARRRAGEPITESPRIRKLTERFFIYQPKTP
jgi:hypothetical protein